ncbi:trehalose-phosphate phosphatase A [Olea europaea subsp. europaea]|uniref:Trehalose-phosphate phosphatase A n=1 Tax=Olea europaea subsp. europaea TaxID=158383 RepID=A0A8S0Q1G2_OLEEU|nr:trehalose-phosphate phosphatase A [Olea europaea subsp. europaea]
MTLLEMWQNIFPTAIISGRSRDKVFEFIGLTELYYAGSHGMDIMGPARHISNDMQGKEVSSFQTASEILPMIDEVFKSLLSRSQKMCSVLNRNILVQITHSN